MESNQQVEKQSEIPNYQIEDPTKGISHMPLTEQEKKDPFVALKNFPGYVTLAFGRIYQNRIREGGGLPDTSNPVLEAAAGKSDKEIGQAVLEGATKRAEKQIKFWEKNGISIPEKALPAVKDALALGYAGLNVLEATILITAGEDAYKKFLELEEKGGVVDWAGGGDDSSSSESNFSVPIDEEQRAAMEGRITEAQQKNIDHLKEEIRRKYIEKYGSDEGFDDWYNNFSKK